MNSEKVGHERREKHVKSIALKVKNFCTADHQGMQCYQNHEKRIGFDKLQIALKECSESEYWLELLIESGYWDDVTILEQCIEVKKLLISSINTAKNSAK